MSDDPYVLKMLLEERNQKCRDKDAEIRRLQAKYNELALYVADLRTVAGAGPSIELDVGTGWEEVRNARREQEQRLKEYI
jgi:hypothetical protein